LELRILRLWIHEFKVLWNHGLWTYDFISWFCEIMGL